MGNAIDIRPRCSSEPKSARSRPRKNWKFYFSVVMVCVMAVLLWPSSRSRIYDERYHLDRTDQLIKGRPIETVFTEPTPSAVGPLFPLCMWGVETLAGPDTRWARAATFIAMLACLGLTAKAFQLLGHNPSDSVWLFAAIPFVISSMMALTEIWALLPALAAFVLLWMPLPLRYSALQLLGSGVCFALAVLTRQTTVVLLPALITASVRQRGFRLLDLVLLGCPSAIALLLLISLWGGFVPPGQEHLAGAQLFSLGNFIRAAVYCAAIGVLMDPDLLLERTMWPAMAVTLLANLLTNAVSYPILLTVFPEHGRFTILFRELFWGAGCGLAAGFFATHIWRLRKRLNQPGIDCLSATGLVVLSCGLVPGSFSSRYVVLAVPFLALVSFDSERVPDFVRQGCVVCGFLLGLNSLRHYGLW